MRGQQTEEYGEDRSKNRKKKDGGVGDEKEIMDQ